MRLDWRKCRLALLSVMVGLGVVLPGVMDWSCGCLFRYSAAIAFGDSSLWPLPAANGVLYVVCAIGVSLPARRRGRRFRVWTLACVLFHPLALCHPYVLEPSGVEGTLARDVNGAPL